MCRTSPSTCVGDFSCQRYTGLDDGSGNMGVCEPTCDPVTQTRLFDDAPACGSPNPAMPTRGCYGMPGSTTVPTQFTCAPAGNPSKIHRVAAADAPGSSFFLNSCAPGYAPLLPRSSTDGTAVCIAFCTPGESYSGSTAEIQGVTPHTCPARGASTASEECRYFWLLEDPRAPLSPYSNTVGFCLDTSLYTWDDDKVASTPEVPFPSCAALPNTDLNGNGIAENVDWACGPRP